MKTRYYVLENGRLLQEGAWLTPEEAYVWIAAFGNKHATYTIAALQPHSQFVFQQPKEGKWVAKKVEA